MTPFLPLVRRAPRVAARFVGGRFRRPRRSPIPAMAGGQGTRERAAAALLAGAEILLACGYGLLMALVCSAVLGSGT